MNVLESLKYFLPEIFLLAGAFGALFTDFFVREKRVIAGLGLLTLAGYFLLIKFRISQQSMLLFFGSFSLDPLTRFAGYLVPFATFITILLSMNYREMPKLYEGEYYVLFLFMTFALIVMAAAANLLMIFLSVEFVSLLSYLMVGLLKKDIRSKEAAVKYLLFGSAASAVMLYGMSILFGMSGSLDLLQIMMSVRVMSHFSLSLIAMIFFLAGLGFKISMAPFHLWAPDVYEAAPTPVTAFLTVAPKAVGFLLLIRVLGMMFFALTPLWQNLITGLSILTMTIGNVTAISQTNIKRLIAYSSIAQAGYILMGLAVFGRLGVQSILIYLVAYTLTNLGAFAVIIAVSNRTGNDWIASYAGLAKKSPGMAAALTLFLLSLAGIPPLAGFIGKFYVFSGAMQTRYYVLATAAALNSAVAAYYYFKIVRAMYLETPENSESLRPAAPLRFALFLTMLGVVLLGIMPQNLIAFVQSLIQ